jgi:lantibiotic leader peptide-processing serine protease
MPKHGVCRALLLLTAVVLTLAFAGAASAGTYVVLYKAHGVPANAGEAVRTAGGTVLASYPQIGVIIAESSQASFRATLMKDNAVDGVSATADFATRLNDGGTDSADAEGPPQGDLPNTPATDADSLSALQWDMRQIHTPQAHAITGGSPSVLVGDIDTGIDFDHPDLQANIDVANSVNCVTGAPVPGLAAQDDNGHGTHTAGTIAAAANGVGIVGVAPNVKVAGIKSGNADGFFFPQAVICGFMWAATHHMDVTNNSYFADPWEYNCRNDPVQRAIWKAEQRAILYAEQQGVTVVAAEGNDSDDTAHPTQDQTSPDDTTPVTRDITNACVIIPVEVPGVIGVSATGSAAQGTSAGQYADHRKSFYSSFGVGVTQLAAPGGDSLFGTPPFTGTAGRVLSTWPTEVTANCLAARRVFDAGAPGALWCYQQGTSMASPHVAGVAALIISRFGDSTRPNGKMRPNQVKALLAQTADPQACPTELPAAYVAIVGVNSELPQECQGGPGYNSWYGNGEVDAFNAVTHTAGN